jgi:hypothetical protein
MSSTVPKGKKALPAQYVRPVPLAFCGALALWGVVQQWQSAEAFTLKTLAYVLGVSYLYTDYWLWMLHCFLDRVENLEAKLGFVRDTAVEFQGHHDHPVDILTANHLGEIDDQVLGFSIMGLLLGAWTSAATKFIVVMISFWGGVGGANHFYGHAMTHGYRAPAFYTLGQKWGLLPTSKHHKIHHTAPFDCNWNFLVGLHKFVYEPLYFATGSSYKGLWAQFYALNPAVGQLLAVGTASLLA